VGEALIFAPLIRVSTDAQAKRGYSLKTQRKQLEYTIKSMGGKIYNWYSGQEHATPEQERKILNNLLTDAGKRRFNAVIVCDTSRWSRDNRKSKEYLEFLKKHGIRFFVGSTEFQLDNPMHNYMLGMGVETEEFYAAQQNYKSLINSIEKARKGYPTRGKIPYGRIFDKKTGQWGIDSVKQEKVNYAIDQYLSGTSMRDISKTLGRSWGQVHYIFTKCLGENWQIKFSNENLNINETVTFKIPPLVSEDIIQKVREKLEANKTWSHGQLKNNYLLGRMIFCGHCGHALVGAEYHGRLYYRHQAYYNCGVFNSIRADEIEDRVLNEIFENFGDTYSIEESIKRALPDLDKVKLLNHQMKTFKRELRTLVTQRGRLINAIADGAITNDDASNKIREIKDKESIICDNIMKIQAQLDWMPTEQQISTTSQLMQRTMESYFKCDAHKREMSFEDKRELLQNLFSGKTSDGKRAGIFITVEKSGRYSWHCEIKGSLNLYNLRGYLNKANLNIVDPDHPRGSENPRYTGARPPDRRRKSLFQFPRRRDVGLTVRGLRKDGPRQ